MPCLGEAKHGIQGHSELDHTSPREGLLLSLSVCRAEGNNDTILRGVEALDEGLHILWLDGVEDSIIVRDEVKTMQVVGGELTEPVSILT